MAFVSDVKCGKCDRRYSGLRGRCPYCGTRRGKNGKHANQGGNTTGKLIVGLILIFLSPSSGLFANLFKLFDAEFPNLMAKAASFKHVYVWSDIWQHLGWDSIIYLAALAGIDPTYYEAATVDGATTLQKIRFIDIPMILPTAMVLLILRAGSILGIGFEKVFLLQNVQNIMSSEIISTYVYKMGMQSMQYSLSTAIGLFNTVVNVIVLLLVNLLSRKLTENSLF